MKLLFDESLSPRLVVLLRDLFPESESAMRNGLARTGNRSILDHAAAYGFYLGLDRQRFLITRVHGAWSSSSLPAIIRRRLRRKYFGVMQSVSRR